jgi:hypothetical protein
MYLHMNIKSLLNQDTPEDQGQQDLGWVSETFHFWDVPDPPEWFRGRP